jgi:hypothetical protein
MDTDKKI